MSAPVYVLGGAQTDFARNWAREGLSIYDMFRETLDSALTKTGISPEQIEVGHVGNFVGDLFTGQGLIGGFLPKPIPSWPLYPPVAMKQPVLQAPLRCSVPCAI